MIVGHLLLAAMFRLRALLISLKVLDIFVHCIFFAERLNYYSKQEIEDINIMNLTTYGRKMSAVRTSFCFLTGL